MRHRERSSIDRFARPQDVQIERARGPTRAPLATVLLLDRVQALQELWQRELAAHTHSRVQMWRLRWSLLWSERFTLIDLAAAQQLHAGRLRECGAGRAQRGQTI